jgi:hypothetical protein
MYPPGLDRQGVIEIGDANPGESSSSGAGRSGSAAGAAAQMATRLSRSPLGGWICAKSVGMSGCPVRGLRSNVVCGAWAPNVSARHHASCW